jgi:hypothetical protein
MPTPKVCSLCCPDVEEAQGAVPEGGSSQLLVHSKMYEIGDKYDVPGLKELAREKFSRACREFWEGGDFIVAAEYAFTTTVDDDEGLRKCIEDVLVTKKGLLLREDVKTFLASRQELTYKILIKATQ